MQNCFFFLVFFTLCFVDGWLNAGRPSPKGVARCDSSSPEVTVGGARDIYLGGSCGSTTWREQTAIPLLK